MSKIYQAIIKVFGVIALLMFLVAAILYLRGDKTSAEIALGIGISISGITLIMYSFR
jgi:hypothetical protein